MAWCQLSTKPLSEPMIAYHNDAYMCVTQPQWVEMKVVLITSQIKHNEDVMKFADFHKSA